MKTPINHLRDFGQSFWYDNIRRAMLKDGSLAQMIRDDDLRGITSNPAIFEKAINGSEDYSDSLTRLALEQPDLSGREYFYQLAVEDIRNAADLLDPVYQESNAHDGYVSIEVSPDLAYDSEASIREARELFARIGKANVMIKIPTTREGIPVIEQLISDGINVNATLLFSPQRYEEVAHAYLRGLTTRMEKGHDISRVASVASFFVSRVDNQFEDIIDHELMETRQALKAIRGRIGIINAQCAYLRYQNIYGNEFSKLKKHGAQPQRLLWASTGTKNPDWSDVLYIESLIGKDTVNTIPPATLAAFKDHGVAQATLEQNLKNAAQQFELLSQHGIKVEEAMQQLEDDGVATFATAFDKLTQSISTQVKEIKKRQSAA